jgi:hypothetical protein
MQQNALKDGRWSFHVHLFVHWERMHSFCTAKL